MAMDDFKVGDQFSSPSKTLTDAHFLFFSGLTGDNHPVHYDVEHVKAHHLRGRVAHGLLMSSMTALGASPGSQIADGMVMIEQGCRFVRYAIPGDTIYPRLTVEKIWTEGSHQFLRLATQIKNQRDEVLLEGFHVYQKLRRRKTRQSQDEA